MILVVHREQAGPNEFSKQDLSHVVSSWSCISFVSRLLEQLHLIELGRLLNRVGWVCQCAESKKRSVRSQHLFICRKVYMFSRPFWSP